MIDEPHIVLEYRELIPKLDKHCVRLFAEGGGKRYLEECRKTEEQVQAERLLLDADLSEREAIEIKRRGRTRGSGRASGHDPARQRELQ